jgi:ABC-2 type transport system ATP-binding protein
MQKNASKPKLNVADAKIETAISLKNLTKLYTLKSGAKKAIDDINLNIPTGEIFGILGPNGAGKSTIINIISGITEKTSGEIFIMGQDMSKNANLCKHKIGTAIQEVMLDPFFTVKEYLTFIAGYYEIDRKEAKNRIEEVCGNLDLLPHLEKNTRMLSGGMKRRLIIAKALIHNPDIIILDEPTAGVDIELRNSLWNYMVSLNKAGKTIILTTHYLQEAEQFCDNIAFISDGKIILEDTKTNILQRVNTKKITLLIENEGDFKLPEGCTKQATDKGILLEFTYNPKVFSLEKLFQSLYEAKVSIKDISTLEPNLDDIFLSIYKHNV